MITIEAKQLGDSFREARMNLGLSTNEISELAKLPNPQHYRMMEMGRAIMKNPEYIARICNVLCDNGNLMAKWCFAYLKLEFTCEENRDESIKGLAEILNRGPIYMGGDEHGRI